MTLVGGGRNSCTQNTPLKTSFGYRRRWRLFEIQFEIKQLTLIAIAFHCHILINCGFSRATNEYSVKIRHGFEDLHLKTSELHWGKLRTFFWLKIRFAPSDFYCKFSTLCSVLLFLVWWILLNPSSRSLFTYYFLLHT